MAFCGVSAIFRRTHLSMSQNPSALQTKSLVVMDVIPIMAFCIIHSHMFAKLRNTKQYYGYNPSSISCLINSSIFVLVMRFFLMFSSEKHGKKTRIREILQGFTSRISPFWRLDHTWTPAVADCPPPGGVGRQ